MDNHVVGEFTFEWDDNKAKINKKLHKIEFKKAATLWDDPEISIDMIDDRFDYGEKRFLTIGPISTGQIIMVAYCERNNKIRLISARKAQPSEEQAYRERFKKK